MLTQLLPRNQWFDCLRLLSANPRHWLVSVEVHAEDFHDWSDPREWPLHKIELDLGGGPHEFISMTFGAADDPITRTIPSPARLRFAWTAKDSQQALTIESASGVSLCARFRPNPHASTVPCGIRLAMSQPQTEHAPERQPASA
jgi:hypothetical protein